MPIENIGTGPALRIEATVEFLTDGASLTPDSDKPTPAIIAGLKVAGSVAPMMHAQGLLEVTSFALTLTYEDVGGKRWITKAHYIKTLGRYDDLTVDTLSRGVARYSRGGRDVS